ncbi:uncharacterized protein LOC34624219 [Cyclospora cayetanensis]|uniref:Uncharacterized protein LOC34624219 n=1 Tax=Cyclospora cayetanensis TaxID=88456 RepID=A0A6P6RQ46_9EIME|nr:uncharacterized protein LOC34624219 [Cyclospora cayetanensis]
MRCLQVVEILDDRHPLRLETPLEQSVFALRYVGPPIPGGKSGGPSQGAPPGGPPPKRVLFGERVGFVCSPGEREALTTSSLLPSSSSQQQQRQCVKKAKQKQQRSSRSQKGGEEQEEEELEGEEEEDDDDEYAYALSFCSEALLPPTERFPEDGAALDRLSEQLLLSSDGEQQQQQQQQHKRKKTHQAVPWLSAHESEGESETERFADSAADKHFLPWDAAPFNSSDSFMLSTRRVMNAICCASHFCLSSVFGGRRARLNCEWQVVYVDGWPHVILCSIPDVPLLHGEQLFVDYGSAWYEAADAASLRNARQQLRGMRLLQRRGGAAAAAAVAAAAAAAAAEDDEDEQTYSHDQLCALCYANALPNALMPQQAAAGRGGGGRSNQRQQKQHQKEEQRKRKQTEESGSEDEEEEEEAGRKEEGIVCDGCNRAFHLECVCRVQEPPSRDVEWFCCLCMHFARRVLKGRFFMGTGEAKAHQTVSSAEAAAVADAAGACDDVAVSNAAAAAADAVLPAPDPQLVLPPGLNEAAALAAAASAAAANAAAGKSLSSSAGEAATAAGGNGAEGRLPSSFPAAAAAVDAASAAARAGCCSPQSSSARAPVYASLKAGVSGGPALPEASPLQVLKPCGDCRKMFGQDANAITCRVHKLHFSQSAVVDGSWGDSPLVVCQTVIRASAASISPSAAAAMIHRMGSSGTPFVPLLGIYPGRTRVERKFKEGLFVVRREGSFLQALAGKLK